jgi:CheY-like chemotaxis protein
MGSQLQVTSQVGVGSVFSFTLAVTATDRSEALPVAPPPPDVLLAQALPLRILVVEDNPVNQMVANALLQRLGYQPDMASNGLLTLAALERQSYDIILMDVEMPEMNGLEATRQIRARYGRQPRIIGVSASALAESRQQALAVGMDDYLSKPVRLETLVQTLQQRPVQSPVTSSLSQHPLNHLRSMLGPDAEQVIPRIVQKFYADTQQRLQNMQLACENQDWLTLGKLAHGLKGTSSQVGATALYALARTLEHHSRAIDSPPDQLRPLVLDLQGEYERVRILLEAEVPSCSNP